MYFFLLLLMCVRGFSSPFFLLCKHHVPVVNMFSIRFDYRATYRLFQSIHTKNVTATAHFFQLRMVHTIKLPAKTKHSKNQMCWVFIQIQTRVPLVSRMWSIQETNPIEKTKSANSLITSIKSSTIANRTTLIGCSNISMSCYFAT